GIEGLVTEVAISSSVEVVGAALGDDVDGRAFTAPVGGGKALGADFEFLHGFQRKLHHRSAHRIVLVVDAVYRHVDVAAAGAVHAKCGDTHLSGIVGVHLFHARSQVGKTADIAPIDGELFDLLGGNVHADIGFGLVYDRRGSGDFNRLAYGTWIKSEVLR